MASKFQSTLSSKVISFLAGLFVTAGFILLAHQVSAGTLVDDDQVQVNTVISDCLLSIRVYPEKRIPPVNNWDTFLTVEIRNTNNDLLLSIPSLETNNQGFGQVNTCDLGFTPVPGTYNFRVRGSSHLWKRYNNVSAFNALGSEVDLTGYPPLLASEISPVLDNFINGLDVSNIANSMYSGDYAADLNQDGNVNSLDISIFFANLYRFGE